MADWKWLGHSSVRIDWKGGVLYLDPFEVGSKKAPPADLVLVTNPRLGYWSPEDVTHLVGEAPVGMALAGDRPVVAGPAEVASAYGARGRSVRPGDAWEYRGVRIRAVPAYTVGRDFFPRERGWLGYLLEVEGTAFYHAGATDRIPEMEGLHADVAFLPVCGRYVMGAEEATAVADALGATIRVGTSVAGDRYLAVPGFTT